MVFNSIQDLITIPPKKSQNSIDFFLKRKLISKFQLKFLLEKHNF